MMSDECGMMNEESASRLKFITHHSAFRIEVL